VVITFSLRSVLSIHAGWHGMAWVMAAAHG